MYTGRDCVALIFAGILGALANAVAAASLSTLPLMELVMGFGRYAVAIVVALMLPIIFTWRSDTKAWIVAVAVLTLVTSFLSSVVFSIGAPLGFIFAANTAYAVTATMVFALIAR